MSSILEALKKLEEEKAARRGGTGNIAGKVTATGRRARQRPAWLMPAGMAAAAAAAVLVTYAVMGGFSPRNGGTVSGKDTEPASQQLAISAPQAAPPDATKSAAPQSPLPAPGAHEAASIGAARQAAPVPGPAAKHALPHPTSPRESLPEKAAPPPLPVSDAPFPELNVTGIAWQKDSASRLAVVNGNPVVEGELIEGARVKEIHPDRVLFSFNNKEFQVSLGTGQ